MSREARRAKLHLLLLQTTSALDVDFLKTDRRIWQSMQEKRGIASAFLLLLREAYRMKYHFLFLPNERDQPAELSMVPFVQKGAHSYVEYDKANVRALLCNATNACAKNL